MSSPTGVAARGATPARRRTWPQRLVLLTGALVTVTCLTAAAAVGYGEWKLLGITRYDVDVADAEGGPENWLLVGSDSRASIDPAGPNADVFLNGDVDQYGKRADTIMIARVDPSKGRIDLLSIPRDLWIVGPDGNHARINGMYGSSGGRQALIDAIKSNLDIDVHHYVEVDFGGFSEIIGLIEGVPMWIDQPMRDGNSGLSLWVDEPTCVVLGPYEALAFARARHLEVSNGVRWVPDPTGDLGRMSRQQLFMRSAFSRAKSKVLKLVNPAAYKQAVDAVVDNVGIDDELPADRLIDLARHFAATDDDSLITHSLPLDEFTTDGGAQVVGLRQPDAAEVLGIFGAGGGSGGEASDGAGAAENGISVRVLNGSRQAGHARQVAEALEAVGFDVGERGDLAKAEGVRTRTEVRYGDGAAADALTVARHLQAGARLVADPELAAGDVVVVTATDLREVIEHPHPADAAVIEGRPAAPPTSSAPATTTTAPTSTTHYGLTPGEPPPGVSCP